MRLFRSLIRASFPVAAFALVAVVALGCGGGGKRALVTVKGTISYKGKPLPRGNISFWSDAGANQFPGVIHPDGTYEALVPVGGATITVNLIPNNPGRITPKTKQEKFKFDVQPAREIQGPQEIRGDLRSDQRGEPYRFRPRMIPSNKTGTGTASGRASPRFV